MGVTGRLGVKASGGQCFQVSWTQSFPVSDGPCSRDNGSCAIIRMIVRCYPGVRRNIQHDGVKSCLFRIPRQHHSLNARRCRCSYPAFGSPSELVFGRADTAFAFAMALFNEIANDRNRERCVRASISQWPAPGTIASRTSVAALRINTAISAPNDFSPPTARTGIFNLVCRKTLLSSESLLKAANWANPARMAPSIVYCAE